MATELKEPIGKRWARISYRLVEISEVADKWWLMSARVIDVNEDPWPFSVARVIIRIPREAIEAERLRLYPPVLRKKKPKRCWMKVLKRQAEDAMHVLIGRCHAYRTHWGY